MKKMLLAVSMAFAATAVQATPFTLDGASGVTLTANFNPSSPTFDGTQLASASPTGTALLYTEGEYGTLLMGDQGNMAQFTYLGKEAGFNNFSFASSMGGVETVTDTEFGAQYTSKAYSSGDTIEFGFGSNGVQKIVNGDASTVDLSIIFFDADVWNGKFGTDYDYLIGYNDPSTGHFDADDMVLGVRAVPVPAALPLMASALGMFGIARRRKSA